MFLLQDRGDLPEQDHAANVWDWMMDTSMAATDFQWPHLGARYGMRAALVVLSGSLLMVLVPLSGLEEHYRAVLKVLLHYDLWGGDESIHTYTGQSTGLTVTSAAIEFLVFKQKPSPGNGHSVVGSLISSFSYQGLPHTMAKMGPAFSLNYHKNYSGASKFCPKHFLFILLKSVSIVVGLIFFSVSSLNW